MGIVKVISVCFVSLGALFMAASILSSSRTYATVPPTLLKKWKLMTTLMVFFLIGYVGYVIIELSGIVFQLELITGVIFLGGAFFVYIVINLSKTTISDLNRSAREIKEAHDGLEVKVKERTQELQSTVEQLHQEVLEREKAEKQIVESHAELNQIFNTTTDGMRIIDTDFNMIRANETFCELTGLSKEEMEGRKCFEVFHGAACHTEICPLKLIKDEEKKIEIETDKKRQNGTTVTCIVTATPYLAPSGELLGIVEAFKNITERKEMEISLIDSLNKTNELAGEITIKHKELETAHKELKNTQTQMLQREKMASVGQLAAGVAHEINNPMGFITSNLGTLKKYVGKYLEFIETQSNLLASLNKEDQVQEARKKFKIDFLIEDSESLLDETLDGAMRVTEIVQNLKGFSRLDEARISKSSINECIETTLKIIWNKLKYKTTIHKEYGSLSETYCNSQELNQVFMNILVNASHSIDKQGEITIRTWQEDENIKVSITDTGSGIAEDKLERIFEPFFTTKEVGKGTGLGLSICYDIVKKHDGEIIVESEIGSGTTFTVILPINESAEEHAEEAA